MDVEQEVINLSGLDKISLSDFKVVEVQGIRAVAIWLKRKA
jgi:hypothetical protein